jgi:hypothetical protein
MLDVSSPSAGDPNPAVSLDAVCRIAATRVSGVAVRVSAVDSSYRYCSAAAVKPGHEPEVHTAEQKLLNKGFIFICLRSAGPHHFRALNWCACRSLPEQNLVHG